MNRKNMLKKREVESSTKMGGKVARVVFKRRWGSRMRRAAKRWIKNTSEFSPTKNQSGRIP